MKGSFVKAVIMYRPRTDKTKERDRERRQTPEYKERRLEINRKYRLNHPYRPIVKEPKIILTKYEIDRAARVKRKYGIGVQDLQIMADKQNGKCCICKIDFDKTHVPCVDHDHRTGAIRGVLCNNCNLGLGRFFDNPEYLQAAANYLASRC
jgi:hypothetical protein